VLLVFFVAHSSCASLRPFCPPQRTHRTQRSDFAIFAFFAANPACSQSRPIWKSGTQKPNSFPDFLSSKFNRPPKTQHDTKRSSSCFSCFSWLTLSCASCASLRPFCPPQRTHRTQRSDFVIFAFFAANPACSQSRPIWKSGTQEPDSFPDFLSSKFRIRHQKHKATRNSPFSCFSCFSWPRIPCASSWPFGRAAGSVRSIRREFGFDPSQRSTGSGQRVLSPGGEGRTRRVERTAEPTVRLRTAG
jgi:hypothetical protein